MNSSFIYNSPRSLKSQEYSSEIDLEKKHSLLEGINQFL